MITNKNVMIQYRQVRNLINSLNYNYNDEENAMLASKEADDMIKNYLLSKVTPEFKTMIRLLNYLIKNKKENIVNEIDELLNNQNNQKD